MNVQGDRLRCEARWAVSVPLVGATVQAGFPSPAEDFLEKALDFNELLIEHPAATFAVRVAGDSMTGIGIFPGDIAVVDRAVIAADGSIVLALLDGAFTLKRFNRRGDRVWLSAENPGYLDISLTEAVSFEVWGVVRRTIRIL